MLLRCILKFVARPWPGAFGASHSYGPSGAVVTGLIGLALGVMYQMCGRRLLPCVAAHMTFNLIGSVALFLG